MIEETENATPEGVEPELTLDEAKAVVATKVHPRVTEASIKAKIADVTYMTVGGAAIGTMCFITLKNGWTSTGFSAPADPRNFDAKVGERYAFDNAFKPLWQLEGYLLREQLYLDEDAKHEALEEAQRDKENAEFNARMANVSDEDLEKLLLSTSPLSVA